MNTHLLLLYFLTELTFLSLWNNSPCLMFFIDVNYSYTTYFWLFAGKSFYPVTFNWSVSLYLKFLTITPSVPLALVYLLGSPLEVTTPILSEGFQNNSFISCLQQWVTSCYPGLAISCSRKAWISLVQIECSFCSAYGPWHILCLWPCGESTEWNHILGMQWL